MRHAKTDCNETNQRQGWLDSHINAEGRRQAVLISRELNNIKFDHIYSSDLFRALETCEYITGPSVTTCKDLRERDWQSESDEDVAIRVSKFLQEDLSGNTLIVTHGNTARHLIAQLQGSSVKQVSSFDNCEVRWPSAMDKGIFGETYLTDWKSLRPGKTSK